MIKKCVLASLVILSHSVSVNACEWHGADNFGIFGHMNMQARTQNMSKAVQSLSVDHKEEINVGAGTPSSIEIEYKAPLRYQRIKLEFIPSEQVTLLSEETMNITQLRGDIELQFQAKSKGQHVIMVNVSASDNGKPHFNQQRIVVNAS
ncbi:hypothetical protein [Aliiglaciecola sp. M165]|uniref:hypothetical protein n=1 Tax=Aliiglaciecola sp. M165 TaxID=2593649 RepID=UPI00118055FE|nr:hypothetical protein [Aliiglaciecola sp. M165]TRY33744.1 hypothetical protein FM019_00325 [Aliiglaciecola sp. M165]